MVVCSENQLFYISSIEMSCFVHTWSCADVVVEIIIFEVYGRAFSYFISFIPPMQLLLYSLFLDFYYDDD